MTPEEIEDLKKQHPGKRLLFNCGDYYEAYGKDAKAIAKIVHRDLSKREGINVVSIPVRYLKESLQTLLDMGEKIAVCEQTQEEGPNDDSGDNRQGESITGDESSITRSDSGELSPSGGNSEDSSTIRHGKGDVAKSTEQTRYTVAVVPGKHYKLEDCPNGTHFAYLGKTGELLNCNPSEAKVRLSGEKPVYWSPATIVQVVDKNNQKNTDKRLPLGKSGVESECDSETQPNSEETDTMKLTKTNAVKLLQGLGIKSASEKKWSNKQIEDKLQKVASTPGALDPEKITDTEIKELLDDVLSSLNAGRPVEVVGGETSEKEKDVKTTEKKGTGDKKGSKPKAEAVKSAAQTTKKKDKGNPDKSSAEVDKFGSRVGSKLAKVNSLLSNKPITMSELVEKAELGDTCNKHMKKLIEAGHVVKTDEGYKLASKKK